MPRHASILSSLIFFAAVSCSEKPGSQSSSAPAVSVASPVPASAAPEPQAADFLPRAAPHDGYVGSSECRSCHEEQYKTWRRSYHRTMTQFAGTNSIQADFAGVILTNEATRFTLNHTNDEYWVRMEHLDREAEAFDVRLGLVTGSHHMQVFWVPNGMGNCQVGFPFTWLIPEKKWVPRNSTFLRPPDVDLRPETWNYVCARCHATATVPNLDRASHAWGTEVAELGISCEACHGPAGKHVAEARRLGDLFRADGSGTNLAVIHPGKISAVRSGQICGFCHSMKYWDAKEGWPEHPFSFRPGDDLDATTPVMRPSRLAEQPWLQRAFERNPELSESFFWPDGMIRVSGRDYNGLIESPCYKSGKFSCVTCHSLHKSDPDGQLARNKSDNKACTQCHQQFEAAETLASHTHHLGNSSGSECYNCHMPHTTYGVLKAIRSHQISSPKVEVEFSTGRPNACNLCHLDQSLGWTADYLSKWYGQPTPDLTPELRRIPDSARLAIAGDAGQRVLLAWHLGWEPALAASPKTWRGPLLARLAADPYAAVRLVASRAVAVGETNIVLNPEEGARVAALLDEMAAKRDGRPVRLRE